MTTIAQTQACGMELIPKVAERIFHIQLWHKPKEPTERISGAEKPLG